MLTRLFSPLIILLGLTGVSNAQFGNCDYEQIIEVGKSYPIFSPNYPRGNYNAGTHCRWTAKSDHPINMTCSVFHVPQSQRCSVDVVVIQTSDAPGQHYCGIGTLSVVSKNNQIITELHTKSSRGKFFCTIQTVSVITEKNCRCGWTNPTRIVGGEDTGVNEFPMMAGLVDIEHRDILCGGTIINNKQILTAAHCVKNRNIGKFGVLVGEHDITRGNETNATKLFRVRSVIIHEEYSDETQANDIAIVIIDGTIEFNQLVGPACLPFQYSSDTFDKADVKILGWGSIGNGEKKSNILQKVQLVVYSNDRCLRFYRHLTDRQLCTGAEDEEKDSCQSDSGGPVLWKNPSTRQIFLLAIVSYGKLCASGHPAINSRVSAYIDWILRRTPPGFKYCKAK